MASIRYRVDRLLRAIQSALGSGVAAQVADINADLLAEGVAWDEIDAKKRPMCRSGRRASARR